MLRRLCTARETKLQLAASLARGQPKAIEVKITSLGRLKIEKGLTPGSESEAYPTGSSLAMWTILALGRA